MPDPSYLAGRVASHDLFPGELLKTSDSFRRTIGREVVGGSDAACALHFADMEIDVTPRLNVPWPHCITMRSHLA